MTSYQMAGGYEGISETRSSRQIIFYIANRRYRAQLHFTNFAIT